MKNKNLKNRKKVILSRMCFILALLLFIHGCTPFLSSKKPTTPLPVPDTKDFFSKDPVKVTAYLDLHGNKPFRVYIGDIDVTEPGTTFDIQPGVYILRLEDEEGRVHNEPIVITEEKTELHQRVSMPPPQNIISISTGLDECELYIDGELERTFDREISLFLGHGTYSVEIRKVRFQKFVQTITIEEGDPLFIVALLEPEH